MNKPTKIITGAAGGALIGLATGSVVSNVVGKKIKEEMAKVEDVLEESLSDKQRKLLADLKRATNDYNLLPAGSQMRTDKENTIQNYFKELKKTFRVDQLKTWNELDRLGKMYEQKVKNINAISALLGGAAGGFLASNL